MSSSIKYLLSLVAAIGAGVALWVSHAVSSMLPGFLFTGPVIFGVAGFVVARWATTPWVVSVLLMALPTVGFSGTASAFGGDIGSLGLAARLSLQFGPPLAALVIGAYLGSRSRRRPQIPVTG